ncbi:cell wall metabolism sensor histidine kinase WalK [Aerococcaceae bacterium NML210727]|nr:cell wall metabolism sensor histidine kinase WalK [Aerococcaceae bacterium NML210727]MCW6653938.1 cell wall metabolism sensor histidine kinase WalK [Aerococcaceae bacterium NML201296]MCW6663032.1 cell wall metabolism sensor histidine kinase WalK [Aerococcaceae bacterium NML190073]MCW6666560.1 cell wall metabolism sensor histidine kinase WalK [Aerococcaceae bacterium NML190938]MCW6679891.1 cell wall metabolism sensor histidine kinase WalK [Aerococcaceae bacterium NML130460]MDO4774358.1 cell 
MNKKRKFFQTINFKIPLLFIIILLISFQFIGVFFIGQLETQSVKNFKDQINTQVDFLVNNVSPILSEGREDDRTERLTQALETFSSVNRTDIRIIDTEEIIVAANFDYQQNTVGTKTNELAIKNVLVNQQSFIEETYNANKKQHSYNIIKPILSADLSRVVGVVAVSADMNRVYEQTASTAQLFTQSAAIASIASFILAVVLSQGLTRPIEEIRQQAIRISEGIYNYPVTVFGQDELGELAMTVNELAVKVKDAQELTESERQRLDGVLRHMTDGVIATDRRGHVLLVNERALQLLGIEHQAAMGISVLRLLQIRETHTLADLMEEDTEVMMYRRDREGETILKGEFSIIRRETGFITGLVCVLTDVTEQEKTEQERRDFVSNVSHELRTPLTSIKSYTEALSEGAWQDKQIAPEFLNVIQSETDRMMRMIGNLLDLSKIDGGQYKLDSEYIDFKRLVNHILNRFEFMLENGESEKKYRILRDITSREVYVEVDQDRMTQVIDNIMNNAIKYSPDGGVITVKLEDLHSRIVLSISDEGLGVPQKDLPHLFDRFYRVDKARSREQGGTGLGLAISKEVIELHGGKIWAESVENQGSTFIFELPYTNFGIDDEGWDDI